MAWLEAALIVVEAAAATKSCAAGVDLSVTTNGHMLPKDKKNGQIENTMPIVPIDICPGAPGGPPAIN